MQVQDLTRIRPIYDHYILHTTATFHTEPISEQELASFIRIDDPVYRSFLVYEGDTLVGYAYLAPYKPRQAYLRTAEITLYLAPEHCGRGLGPQILALMEAEALQGPVRNLLAVVTAENAASRALFAKAGYRQAALLEQVGSKFDRLLDVCIYQKQL